MSSPHPAKATALTHSAEQRRAAHALAKVKDVEACEEPMKKAYRSYTERIGTAIITNGLGQALATELAAAGGSGSDDPKKQAHRTLYNNLQSWLCSTSQMLHGEDLLEALVRTDQQTYLRAQAEALAWLVWHKKLCRAFLPRGEEE